MVKPQLRPQTIGFIVVLAGILVCGPIVSSCGRGKGIKKKMETWASKNTFNNNSRPANIGELKSTVLSSRCLPGTKPFEGEVAGRKANWCTSDDNEHLPYDLYNEYYSNGKLKTQVTLKNDNMRIVHWFENGQMKDATFYAQHQKHGRIMEWHQNGTLLLEGEYKGDKKNGVFTYRELSGSLKEKGPYKNDLRHGLWTNYHKNGQIASRITWEMGKKHGNMEEFHENKRRKSQGSYFQDQKHGRWTIYSANGRVTEEQNFQQGRKHGKWVSYALNGSQASASYYNNDRPSKKLQLQGSVQFGGGDRLGARPPRREYGQKHSQRPNKHWKSTAHKNSWQPL